VATPPEVMRPGVATAGRVATYGHTPSGHVAGRRHAP